MPMIDVTIPEGALKPEAEARLMKELSDILITHEGYSADNQVARRASRSFFCTVRRRCSSQVSGRPSRGIASCLRRRKGNTPKRSAGRW